MEVIVHTKFSPPTLKALANFRALLARAPTRGRRFRAAATSETAKGRAFTESGVRLAGGGEA